MKDSETHSLEGREKKYYVCRQTGADHVDASPRLRIVEDNCQSPHPGLAAFDHLFPRIRWPAANHAGKIKTPREPHATPQSTQNSRFNPVMEPVLDNASVANNLNYLRFEFQRVGPELKLIAPPPRRTSVPGNGLAWSQPHPSRGARPAILDAPDEIGLRLES